MDLGGCGSVGKVFDLQTEDRWFDPTKCPWEKTLDPKMFPMLHQVMSQFLMNVYK